MWEEVRKACKLVHELFSSNQNIEMSMIRPINFWCMATLGVNSRRRRGSSKNDLSHWLASNLGCWMSSRRLFKEAWGSFGRHIESWLVKSNCWAREQRNDFVMIMQRGAEIVLARESSLKPRIRNREAKKDAEEATQCPVGVRQSQEGLTQSNAVPSKQKSKILLGVWRYEPGGLQWKFLRANWSSRWWCNASKAVAQAQAHAVTA